MDFRERGFSRLTWLLRAGGLCCWMILAINGLAYAQSTAGAPSDQIELAEPLTEPTVGDQVTAVIGLDAVELARGLGYFLVPLLLASIVAVWFSLERVVVLRRGRVIPRPFVRRFLEQLEQGRLDQRTAFSLCEENSSPVAMVFAHGVRKWGKPSVEVEQAIIDGGERQVSQLRKHLRVLNGVATISPLLGLLGTVVGMIAAFNELSGGNAMGRPEELAGGIGMALLTTAAGLTIAIPALIMYMYLAGRVDALVMEMDNLAQELVQLISSEGLAERSAIESAGLKAAATPKPVHEPRKAV